MTRAQTSGRRRRRGDTSFKKVAISLPADLARKIEREVRQGKAPSVSALISDVMAEKLEREGLRELIADMLGSRPLTEKERRWAAKVFGD